MAPRPRHPRRASRSGRRGGAAGGAGAARRDPGITAEEIAAAAVFAARDAADLDAEWAAMSRAERDAVGWAGEEYDAEGHYLAPPDPFAPDPTDTASADPADANDAVDAIEGAVPEGVVRWWEAGWLAAAADGGAGVTPIELLEVATASPGSLGAPDVPGHPGSSLEQLRCLDRLVATLAGHRHGLIATLCPVEDDSVESYRAEQHLVEEIQLATRVGPGVAARAIDTARLLSGPFTPSREDLLAGVISEAHVRALVWETRNVTDDPRPRSCPDCADTSTQPGTGTAGTDAAAGVAAAGGAVATGSQDAQDSHRRLRLDPPGWRSRQEKLAAVQHRVAHYARTQTPSQFATTVRVAICAVDPEGEAERRAKAKAARDVLVGREVDGIGALIDRDDAATVSAIHAALTDAAKVLQAQRGGTAAARAGDPDARLGACRADVLKTLVLGAQPTPGSDGGGGAGQDGAAAPASGTGTPTGPVGPGPGGSWEPRRRDLEGHLVIDWATLRGLADNPVLLDGQPIPAPVGRDLAASVKAWRWMVTDPVTGHLLDYGTRVYLPEPLVRFIKARDGQCAAPYCERPARRCQMDHRKRFPDGPSASWNCGNFCEDRHHPLKTDDWIEVTDSDASGAITYRTQWGQEVRTSPTPYLPNPRPPGPDTELAGNDPPPDTDLPPPEDDPPPF